MASNPTTTGLRFTRLRDVRVTTSHAVSVRACDPRCVSVHTLIAPIFGLAQGRFVSISRGSPPPKKR